MGNAISRDRAPFLDPIRRRSNISVLWYMGKTKNSYVTNSLRLKSPHNTVRYGKWSYLEVSQITPNTVRYGRWSYLEVGRPKLRVHLVLLPEGPFLVFSVKTCHWWVMAHLKYQTFLFFMLQLLTFFQIYTRKTKVKAQYCRIFWCDRSCYQVMQCSSYLTFTIFNICDD